MSSRCICWKLSRYRALRVPTCNQLATIGMVNLEDATLVAFSSQKMLIHPSTTQNLYAEHSFKKTSLPGWCKKKNTPIFLHISPLSPPHFAMENNKNPPFFRLLLQPTKKAVGKPQRLGSRSSQHALATTTAPWPGHFFGRPNSWCRNGM